MCVAKLEACLDRGTNKKTQVLLRALTLGVSL
jgi:hypothetical protein